MDNNDKEIDLCIFKLALKPRQTNECSSISNCNAIKRLLTALSYYNKLNIINNPNDKILFNNFMDTIYQTQVYDDFYHLIHCHQHHIKQIMDLAISEYKMNNCQLSQCNYSDRHFRVNDTDSDEHENNETLKYFDLYKDTLDTLHFYVLHLFQGGLRYYDMDKKEEDETDNNKSEYFDPLLHKISNVIKKSNTLTKRFRRLNGNKFNISLINGIDNELDNKTTKVSDTDSSDTFLDDIYSKTTLKECLLSSDIIKLNGYDTESLYLDLEMYKNSDICNVYIQVKNDKVIINKLIEIMDKTKSYSLVYLVVFLSYKHIIFEHISCCYTVDVGVFAVGIDWKYNKWDDDSEYRVYPHYRDLKEEMINYQYLAIKQVNKIIKKANAYLITQTAKAMIYDEYDTKDGWIEVPITLNNLICIILYCDYSDLSTDFTLSFRKSHQFQTLKQIKYKNSKYYHWTKILRDAIKRYGKNYGTEHQRAGGYKGLSGPFYCGMSVILNISQFNMFIYSPLSTSVHIEVAHKFSGEDGMILVMDNAKGDAVHLNGLDVSWISRYKEEDERLFFDGNHEWKGDEHPINISSIRHISTATNYQEIIQAIIAFDSIISGNAIDILIPNKAHLIVSHLFSDENKNQLSPFMYQTFKLFMDKKKEVTLKMNSIHQYIEDVKFSACIFGETGVEQFEHIYRNDFVIPEDTKNIPIDIINKFNNIQTINMEMTQFKKKYSSFSLFCLLSILESQSSIKQINISGYKGGEKSWLRFVWNRDSFSLKQQYKKKGYIIEYKGYQDIISINKK